MTVPVELLQILFVLATTVVPIIAAVRLVAGHADVGFGADLASNAMLPWPKGVQEEEPRPWRFGTAA